MPILNRGLKCPKQIKKQLARQVVNYEQHLSNIKYHNEMKSIPKLLERQR